MLERAGENGLEKKMKIVSYVFASLTAVIGLLVLIGWIFNDQILKTLHVSFVTMKANTAIAYILGGASLLLILDGKTTALKYRFGILLSLVVILLAVLNLGEDIFKINLGIDELLFKDYDHTDGTVAPGRMSPNTSVCFIMLSLSVLFTDVKNRVLFTLGRFFAFVSVFTAFFILIGYTYGIMVFIGAPDVTRMSLYAAFALMAFSLGVVFARPCKGIIGELCADNPGGIILRVSIPVMTIMMLMLGWAMVSGQRNGLFDSYYGVSLFTAIRVFIVIIISYIVSRFVNKLYMKQLSKEKELREAEVKYGKIAEMNRLKTQFLAVTSHELRTPLTIIKGFNAIMRKDKDLLLNVRLMEYMDIIESNTVRLGHIISEITDIARIESGILTMEKAPGGISAIVNRCSMEISQVAAKRGIKIEVSIQPENLIMNIDKQRLEQAVLNLLNNAVKFSETGGTVKVSVVFPYEGLRPGNIPWKPEHEWPCALLTVTDEGAGVEHDYIDKIFESFYQAEEHTVRHYQGMGLGLFIAKNIVTGHGGIIWAESEGRGKGTSIKALIPDIPADLKTA